MIRGHVRKDMSFFHRKKLEIKRFRAAFLVAKKSSVLYNETKL